MCQIGGVIGYLVLIEADGARNMATGIFGVSIALLRRQIEGRVENAQVLGTQLAYRVPLQPTMDSNTVDTQVEQANFAANSVHYQASLSFITAQIRMLRTAITGGQG